MSRQHHEFADLFTSMPAKLVAVQAKNPLGCHSPSRRAVNAREIGSRIVFESQALTRFVRARVQQRSIFLLGRKSRAFVLCPVANAARQEQIVPGKRKFAETILGAIVLNMRVGYVEYETFAEAHLPANILTRVSRISLCWYLFSALRFCLAFVALSSLVSHSCDRSTNTVGSGRRWTVIMKLTLYG